LTSRDLINDQDKTNYLSFKPERTTGSLFANLMPMVRTWDSLNQVIPTPKFFNFPSR